MSDTNTNKPMDKNKLYISIASILILAILVIIIAIAYGACDNNADSKETTSVASLSVVSESGDQNATIDADMDVREVDFSKKIKGVKKYEAGRDDTLDDPSVATSEDGYTYLSYKYNYENLPTFFGVQPTGVNTGSMLTYVFKDKSLIEIRIQYGTVGASSYDSIVANIKSAYGEPTYSRSYSNDAQQSWWKTADVTLDVICQNEEVVLYYRTNNK